MSTALDKLSKFENYAYRHFNELEAELTKRRMRVVLFAASMRKNFVAKDDLLSHLVSRELIGAPDIEWLDEDTDLYDEMHNASARATEKLGKQFVRHFFVEDDDMDGEEFMSQIEIILGTINADQCNILPELDRMAEERTSSLAHKRARYEDNDEQRDLRAEHIHVLFILIGSTAEAKAWQANQAK